MELEQEHNSVSIQLGSLLRATYLDVQDNVDDVTIVVDDNSQLAIQCQVTDYRLRGEELSNYNVIRFFSDTYEESMRRTNRRHAAATAQSVRGRPANQRVAYLAPHPQSSTVCRVIRSPHHNTLPNFVGKYFPRRDDPDPAVRAFYSASMLLLLKPWRHVRDLKTSNETWEEALERFLRTEASDDTRRILSNIQHFHHCKSSVLEHAAQGTTDPAVLGCDESDDELDELDVAPVPLQSGGGVDDQMLDMLMAEQEPLREQLHGLEAVEVGHHVGIFSEDDHTWEPSAANATGGQLRHLEEWRTRMASLVAEYSSPTRTAQENPDGGDVFPMLGADDEATVLATPMMSEQPLDALNPADLLLDQRRAYNIITSHLDHTLAGESPRQLLMIMVGEGGTGKSRVIQTVTQYFKVRQAEDLLQKAAYTGIAASLIDGKTTHVIGGINVNGHPLSARKQKALSEFWRPKKYLIIDEFSMLAKELFAALERNISAARAGQGQEDEPFGGLNVILCGDPHQFPPVSRRASSALYYPPDTIPHESNDARTGRMLFEMFRTVFLLKEQVRVVDPVWLDFLRHLRQGTVREEDVRMLKGLVLTDSECPLTDFTVPPWDSASLVTPRHAVREAWNDAALRKHCQKQKKQVFICPAEDTIQGRSLSPQERIAASLQCKCRKKEHRRHLPDQVRIAVGMKVMVTLNLATDLDVANGARGEITKIVLHPQEPPITDSPEVRLSYPPAFIVVRLERTRMPRLEGLDGGEIPIEPTEQAYTIEVEGADGEQRRIKKAVHRHQLPITAAYAFTDYRSQGQTLPYVIIDIAKPPTGKLSLFNLYHVAPVDK